VPQGLRVGLDPFAELRHPLFEHPRPERLRPIAPPCILAQTEGRGCETK
jgi:hypothetical protein